jgi:hypothetical protein
MPNPLNVDFFSVNYGTSCHVAKDIRKVFLVTGENTVFQSGHSHMPQVAHQPKSSTPHFWNAQRLHHIGHEPRTAVFGETKARDKQGDVYEQVLELRTRTTFESETFCTRAENRKVHALIVMGTPLTPILKWCSNMRLLDKTNTSDGAHHWLLTAKSAKRANYLDKHPAFVGTSAVIDEIVPIINNHPFFAIAVDPDGHRWKCMGDVTGELRMNRWM